MFSHAHTRCHAVSRTRARTHAYRTHHILRGFYFSVCFFFVFVFVFVCYDNRALVTMEVAPLWRNLSRGYDTGVFRDPIFILCLVCMYSCCFFFFFPEYGVDFVYFVPPSGFFIFFLFSIFRKLFFVTLGRFGLPHKCDNLITHRASHITHRASRITHHTACLR